MVTTKLVCLLALAVLACGDGNPLLGRWAVDADASPPGSALGLEQAGSARLEFLETSLVAGSSSLEVTYRVEENRVTVTTLNGHGTIYEFQPDNNDLMSVQTPMGAIVFRRVE